MTLFSFLFLIYCPCIPSHILFLLSSFTYLRNNKSYLLVQAIICGRVGQPPVQKILRNGRTVTIFTVGTGGMFDQRVIGARDLPKPAQWHRIAVHNEALGAYSVQKLTKRYAYIL